MTAVPRTVAVRASTGRCTQQPLRGSQRELAWQHPPSAAAAQPSSSRRGRFKAGSGHSILTTGHFRDAATGRSPCRISKDRSTLEPVIGTTSIRPIGMLRLGRKRRLAAALNRGHPCRLTAFFWLECQCLTSACSGALNSMRDHHGNLWQYCSSRAVEQRQDRRTKGSLQSKANSRSSTSASTASCADVTLSRSRFVTCPMEIKWPPAPSSCSTRPSAQFSSRSRPLPETLCRSGSARLR